MKKRIQSISISKPCNQSWSEMKPTEHGKFCDMCKHEVIDFTKMTDDEILRHLSKKRGRICGRLSDNQLNRNKNQIHVVKSTPWQKVLAAAAVVLSFGFLKAQESKEIIPPPFQNLDTSQISNKVSSCDSITQEKVSILIQGNVVDKTENEPIFGVLVQAVGFEGACRTNFDGNFTLKIERTLGDTSDINLLFKYRTDSVYQMISDHTKPVNLAMHIEQPEVMLGIIIENKEFTFGKRVKFDRFGRRED